MDRDLDYPLGFKILTKLGRTRYILIYTAVNYFFLGIWSFLEHNRIHCKLECEIIALVIPIITSIILFFIAIRVGLTKKIRLLVIAIMAITSLLSLFGFLFHISIWYKSQKLLPDLSPAIYLGLFGIGLTAFIHEKKDFKYAYFCPKHFNIPLFLHLNQIFGIIIGIGFLWSAGLAAYYHYGTPFHIAKYIPVFIGIISFFVSIWAFRKRYLVITEALVFLFFMFLNILVGISGFVFHLIHTLNIVNSFYNVILFKIPFLAPFVFFDMGILGTIYLLVQEKSCEEDEVIK